MISDPELEKQLTNDIAIQGVDDQKVDESTLTDEQRIELSRRRAQSAAVDDADAGHEGGMGAQGGAADFGNPKNFGLPE